MSDERGRSPEQKISENKILELMHYRQSKLRCKKPDKMKNFGNYFRLKRGVGKLSY